MIFFIIILFTFFIILIAYFFSEKIKTLKNNIDDINLKEEEKSDTWLDIEKNSNDAVVQVFAVLSKFNWLMPFKSPNQFSVTGSGFFINEDGYFISNAHVVLNAKSVWIQVPSLGKINLDANIIGICPDRDLALLKLTDESLKTLIKDLEVISYLDLGNSDEVNRTDKILTLGYPLGQHYLKSTTGIVSGREHIKNRLFIQIDAAINQGSSGGPVLNEHGEVIGISTAMISSAQNIGYMIPVNELKIILDDLYKKPFLRKIDLGVVYHNSSMSQAKFLHNPDVGGLYIYDIYKDSLADKAGIKAGDMIYEINGYKLDMYGDTHVSWGNEKISFSDLISQFKEGENIEITIYRNGQKKEFKFKFEQFEPWPIRKRVIQYEPVDYEIFAGMVFMELTENHIDLLIDDVPELIDYEKIENRVKPRIIITHIFPGSEVDRLEVFIAGDIISEVNEQKVNTLSELRSALKLSIKDGFIRIKTKENMFVVLPLNKILDEDKKFSKDYKYNESQTTEYFLKELKK